MIKVLYIVCKKTAPSVHGAETRNWQLTRYSSRSVIYGMFVNSALWRRHRSKIYFLYTIKQQPGYAHKSYVSDNNDNIIQANGIVETTKLIVAEWRYMAIQKTKYINVRQTTLRHFFLFSWWRHQMETFSALLAICEDIHRSPVNSPDKGHWRGASMFFFYLPLDIRLSKQSWGWWFETLSRSLWRHRNVLEGHLWNHAVWLADDDLEMGLF